MKLDRRTQLSIAYAILTVLLLLVMQSYLDGQVQNISYSEFRNLVAQGAVHELSIGSESITGKVYSEEGEQSFVVTRVEDPGLVERLD